MSEEYLFTYPYIIEKLPNGLVRIIEYNYFKVISHNPGKSYYLIKKVPTEQERGKVISEQDYVNWMKAIKGWINE
jgi:hypothetical protein